MRDGLKILGNCEKVFKLLRIVFKLGDFWIMPFYIIGV